MNGRLYDPLLRRFLNADENIQDPYNTQNYNKYGYVLNNPLMYNDPSGEFFALFGLGVLFWKAVIIGAAVGLASYTVGLAVTGNLYQWSIGGALKSMFWGAVSGAVTFEIGEIFSSAATNAFTAVGDALNKAIGKVGLEFVGAGTHALAQGLMSVMQGGSFGQAFLSGALGSLGAHAFGAAVGSDFANKAIGQIAFGALSGGIGAELTGGNFWQGAVIGGMVAGFNAAMHSTSDNDDDWILNKDGTKTKIGHTGGDTTDYLYDSNKKLIGSKKVLKVEAWDNMSADFSTYGLRLHTEGTGVELSFMNLTETVVTGAVFSRIKMGLNSLNIFKRSDLIRSGSTVVSNQLVKGPGATGATVTWGIKGGGKNIPFHYHIHKYNWYKPKLWFKQTPIIKPPKAK